MPQPFITILLVAVYFPPGRSNARAEEIIANITRAIDSVLSKYPARGIIITGGFNKLELEPLCRRFGLQKMVKFPTRGNSVLDQFLTNMSKILTSTQHFPPLGRSDHQCLVFKPKRRIKLPPVTKKVRQMNPRNLHFLQVAMNNESWETIVKADNVNEKVSVFNNIIGNVLNTVMPERCVLIHQTDKPWILY